MTPVRFTVRPAVAGDAAAMVEVHCAAVQAIDREHYSDEVLSAWSPPPDASRCDWLADLISRDSTLCLVAVPGSDAVVGFCIALPDLALLKALYVHPAYNGRGIGQELLRQVETRCLALGLATLELNASYNAEAFYRRCGYEALGPVVQPLTDTVTMGAIRMVRRFTSDTA
jgi:GNAT superfamily N-acetyltransferase